MNELRPDAPDYPARLRRIREQLDEGLSVYVDHCEYGTSKKMVLVRAIALTREGSFPPVYSDYVFISWIETGCMWWVPGADPGYIASKLDISKWYLDAQSIAAFMENLYRVGTDKPMVTSKEMPR